jgi:hypothetical protein
MSVKNYIGNEKDSFVVLPILTKNKEILLEISAKQENIKLKEQLFLYAEDMQKLLVERDVAVKNEKEKNASYKQLEKFTLDFMILMKQKEKSHKALELAHLDSIERLASAAEFKDDDTGKHIIRMSRFC